MGPMVSYFCKDVLPPADIPVPLSFDGIVTVKLFVDAVVTSKVFVVKSVSTYVVAPPPGKVTEEKIK